MAFTPSEKQTIILTKHEKFIFGTNAGGHTQEVKVPADLDEWHARKRAWDMFARAYPEENRMEWDVVVKEAGA